MAPRHSQGLFIDRVAKAFGGTQALRAVSLHVDRGAIVALLGDYSAGKSTLFNFLGSIHEAHSDRVVTEGESSAFGAAVAKPVTVGMPFVEPVNRRSINNDHLQQQRPT